MFKKPDISGIEKAIDGTEDYLEGGIRTVRKQKYSDIGRGIIVPTRDVIRGVQRLHEAKMPLFERIAQFASFICMVLCIIILIKLVRF